MLLHLSYQLHVLNLTLSRGYACYTSSSTRRCHRGTGAGTGRLLGANLLIRTLLGGLPDDNLKQDL
jgi:hypothetical protein